MNTAREAKKRVVIVGGGITGLSAAWELQQGGADFSVTILEASARWGGKIYTEQGDEFGGAPFVLEMGADALLTRKPAALELARELGLEDRVLPVKRQHSRTFVLHRGKPVPLPDGLQLLVPTHLRPFLRSPLFSARGKLRALLDLAIPPRRETGDETLGAFVRRRLGAEMLDKLAEPLLGGVYNGDAEQQSVLATFPQFAALERQHGSLIRGMRRAQSQRPKSDAPAFVSFQTGTHELVEALVDQLRADLRLNAAIRKIEPLAGRRYRVVMGNGETLEADALILATPASETAKLLAPLAPAAAESLAGIAYSGIGTAHLAYRSSAVPHPLDGFGVVIPRSERRQIDGITWTTSKWDCRAPAGYTLLRVFFGGARNPAALELDDAALLRVLRGEMADILGISAPPLLHRIHRWVEAYPQYNRGHLERVAAAEAALPPNLRIAGSAYRGVGVPDCVRQGRDAAREVKRLAKNRAW